MEAVAVVKARNVCIGVLECIETEYKHSLPEHSPLTDNKINMTHHTNIAYQRGPCISPYQGPACSNPLKSLASGALILRWNVSILFFFNSTDCLDYVSVLDKNTN